MGRIIWKSAGLHLLATTGDGRLSITEDFMRAYYLRPEVHPVEDSCAAERGLFDRLMEQPFRAVAADELTAMADPDAIDNYRAVLGFRDHLLAHDTVEAAYVALFAASHVTVAPVMIDHLVHALMGHILRDVDDPFRARAAEPFFREQKATTGDGRLMLADAEVVEMRAAEPAPLTLTGLLAEGGAREVSLDVLTRADAEAYWARADRFDMVMDFRFTQPALDAFARNLEAWLRHLLGLETRIQPLRSIRDERWSWHVGLDAEATRLLNLLYEGATLDDAAMEAIIGLFRLEWVDRARAQPAMADKPVYLALAKRQDGSVRMKPQNLLGGLPLIRAQ